MHNLKIIIPIIVLALLLVLIPFLPIQREEGHNMVESEKEISLPEIKESSDFSLEEALSERRSRRDFSQEEVTLEEVAQILYSAQGITGDMGKRTAPSAGATYPLEVYLVSKRVDDLERGVYRYLPESHKLEKILEGDISQNLSEYALNQDFIEEAAFNLVITGIYHRTTQRYGERGERYVYMEAGHVGQNVYLQAESLNLSTVVVGAFSDEDIKSLLNLKKEETPLYIIPIGKPL